MKLSTKILLTFMTFLLGIFIFSGLILKREFLKIDKTDKFWDFKNKTLFKFSHLSIDGGNLAFVAVKNNPNKSGIIFKERFDNLIKYHVKNDTLFVKFDPQLYEKDQLKWNRRSKLGVIIFYDKLKSVNINNGLADLEIMNNQKIELDIKGLSDVSVIGNGLVSDSLLVTVQGRSVLNFDGGEKTIKIKYLEALIEDSGKVNIEKVTSEKTKVKLDKKSIITLGAGSMNLLR